MPVFGTGLQILRKPETRVDLPAMHQGHEKGKQGTGQVRGPHTARAIIGFAAEYLVAQRAFRGIIPRHGLFRVTVQRCDFAADRGSMARPVAA